MGYYLYHNKEKKEIEIGKIKENGAYNLMDSYIEKGKIVEYNSLYYVSDNRKLLKYMADQIRAEWIFIAENELKLIKTVEIKNKY